MSALPSRPVWVKRFQAVHQCGVDVAHWLVHLFGIGTRADKSATKLVALTDPDQPSVIFCSVVTAGQQFLSMIVTLTPLGVASEAAADAFRAAIPSHESRPR
jgi:hypothetical protein